MTPIVLYCVGSVLMDMWLCSNFSAVAVTVMGITSQFQAGHVKSNIQHSQCKKNKAISLNK